MPKKEPLTWSCHVCARLRDDKDISVYKHQLTYAGIATQMNVRYCNDRPECLEGAKNAPRFGSDTP